MITNKNSNKRMVGLPNNIAKKLYRIIPLIVFIAGLCVSCRIPSVKLPYYKNIDDINWEVWDKAMNKAMNKAESLDIPVADSIVAKYLQMSPYRYIYPSTLEGGDILNRDTAIKVKRENGRSTFFMSKKYDIKIQHIEDLYKYYILSCLTDKNIRIVLVVPKEYGKLELQKGHRYRITAAPLGAQSISYEYFDRIAYMLGDDIITVWHLSDADVLPMHYLYLNNAIPLN